MWIDVKKEHFAQIEKLEKGYQWESIFIDKPFLAAVPTNNGWDFEIVILTDEVGLEIFSDGDTHPYGWDILDVTHWMKLEEPFKL